MREAGLLLYILKRAATIGNNAAMIPLVPLHHSLSRVPDVSGCSARQGEPEGATLCGMALYRWSGLGARFRLVLRP